MAYINITDTSVTYAIYNAKTRSMRHEVFRVIGAPVSNIDNNIYISAIKNINLEIKEGEKVGLIGHNGAGKSTLLKLLAGIYEPTLGTVEIKGKISSLTDITMGMDPENTGYENIIMRLIFMGMSFKQAKELVDEIIEFSELGEYIDLPIRTYSTGMYLRLAFAIATSIIPEILIMDEMIGAGDASFIQKAQNRILKLIEKTNIMVLSSHDLELLQKICNIGVWLEKGQIIKHGPISEVIIAYTQKLT